MLHAAPVQRTKSEHRGGCALFSRFGWSADVGNMSAPRTKKRQARTAFSHRLRRHSMCCEHD